MARNHSKSKGVWMRIVKKGSGVPSVSIADALDVALCYGWITGQARSWDEKSWEGRFVPRRPGSIWSKINTERAQKLIMEGRMKPAGLREIEEAKRDGRWARAYSPPSRATVPEDFLGELRKSEKAEAFFKTLNRTRVYSIIFRLETSKSGRLREAKIREMIRIFERGEWFR